MTAPTLHSLNRAKLLTLAAGMLAIIAALFVIAHPILEAQSAPARPTRLTATPGDHSVTLSWTNPNDSSITSYQYRVNHNDTSTGRLSGYGTWTEIPNSGSSTTSHTFTGLTNGKEYRYQLRAAIEIGENSYLTSKPAPGAAPWFVSATPKGTEPPPVSNFWAVRVCDHQFKVRWERVSGATGYDLNISTTNRKSWKRVMTNKNYNAWQFSQWSKNKTYWLAIRAVNAHGESIWTDLQSVAPPCPVEGLSASYASNGGVSVKWNPAKRAKVYDVNFSSDGGRSWERMVSDLSATSYSFNRDPQTLPYNPSFLVAVQSRKGGTTGGWRNAPIVLDIRGTRDSDKDIDTLSAAGNNTPDGLWSDGTTMWVSDTGDVKVYAYSRATKARDISKDISLSGNAIPFALGSDGTTMWAADLLTSNKLFAYSISGKSRDASRDITLHADNDRVEAIWTNGVTLWTADTSDTYIYAYTIATGDRDTGKEIDLNTENDAMSGLWSDGVTMWVTDNADNKLYAYKMSDGSRDSAKDYNNLVSNNISLYGIWSDGTTMWVVEQDDDKLFAYHSIDPGAKLTTASLGNTKATLYLGTHTGAWWYKQTSGSGGTCRSVTAGTSTASLTGLTHATAYTYKAYDKANCNADDEIATVAFTTSGTSVSNLGETPVSTVYGIGGHYRTAPFRTGSASGGYTLNSVTIKFGNKVGDPADIEVKIYSDSGGSPGAEVANITLSGPNSPSNQDAEYTCTGSGCALAANTTYHLHLYRGGNAGHYRWKHTASDNETRAPSNNGWSIGNSGHLRITTSDPWGSQTEVGMFKIAATER